MNPTIDSQKPFSIFYSNQNRHFVIYQKLIEGYAYYNHYRLNLLTGKKENFSQEKLQQVLEKENLNKTFSPKKIWHWFYELASIRNDEELLAIELHYEKAQKINDSFIKDQAIHLAPLAFPDFKVYEVQFNEIQKQLLAGNCYQLNLTHQFQYSFDQKLSAVDFFSLWKTADSRGAFAHATYLPQLNKLFLSNSPECLFQKKANTIFSFPIKGTVLPSQLKKLFSEKNVSELDMITDLMRNDLAKLTGELASVIKKRKILKVPGLLHAYSVISAKAGRPLNLLQVSQILFPGGSITGAPKKRVIELIKSIETESRGFYCGSTVLLHGNLQSASINIRSATVDFSTNQLSYGAGGGITLLSKPEEEYYEMLAKRDSFINLFSSL